MKKKFLLLLMLMFSFIGNAQNMFTIEDTTIPQSGGRLVVKLQLSTADLYISYQFKVSTPEGIVYETDDADDVECILGTGHQATHQSTAHWNANTRELAVGVVSFKSALFKGTTVELAIPIAKTSAAVGSELTFNFTGITFIQESGSKDELEDVSVTVTIGEPDDGRLKFYETATALPQYTAGSKADVTVHRTIKAGEWSTLVLPFNLTLANAKAAFGDDVQLAKYNGYTIDYGEDEENITPLGIVIKLADYTIPARGNLKGGTPVLIKTSRDIEEFRLDNVTLTEGVTDEQKADDDYDLAGRLTGSLVKTTIPADGLFLSDNQFWYSTGKTNVKAFRCWFELGAVLDKETDFGARVVLHFDDNEATGVQSVAISSQQAAHTYDLQGREVVVPARKGIYVKDGQKVIIK